VRRRRATSRKPAKAQQTIKAKRGTASKPARNRRLSPLSKDTKVARLARELAEAREQQAATAEILRAISASPTNLERVFAVVAASATRLCDASDATIHQDVPFSTGKPSTSPICRPKPVNTQRAATLLDALACAQI
jgi:hypothetical protein